NAPNPFVRGTEIGFEMPRRDRAVVRVFDPSGRLVRTVFDRLVEAGHQHVTWDGRDEGGKPVASGTYLYDVAVAGEHQTRKMIRVHWRGSVADRPGVLVAGVRGSEPRPRPRID